MSGGELALLKLLIPVYEACKAAYDHVELTRAFGKDYLRAKHQFETQYERLELTGLIRLDDLEHKIYPSNNQHERTRKVLNLLGDMQEIFETCEKLVKDQERKPNTLHKKRPTPRAPVAAHLGGGALPEAQDKEQGGRDPRLPANDAASAASITGVTETPTTEMPNGQLLEQAAVRAEPDGKPKNYKSTKSQGKQSLSLFRQIFPSSKHSTPENANSNATANITALDKPESAKPPSTMPLLNTPAVGTVRERNEAEASSLHSRSDWFTRSSWASSARNEFRRHIKELRTYNNDLESLLRVRLGSEPSKSWGETEGEYQIIVQARMVQSQLEDLHASLRSLNPRQTPWTLNLQLQEDDFDAKNFLDVDPLKLREDGMYLTLQRHGPGGATPSDLFVVEAPSRYSSSNRALEPGEIVQGLNRGQLLENEHSEHDLVSWGAMPQLMPPLRFDSPPEFYWLFKDQFNEWHLHESLAQAFTRDEAACKMTRRQRVDLSLMVSRGFLHLLKLRPQFDPSDLANFKYYLPKEAETGKWDDEDPLLLSPFLAFGLGQHPNSIGRRPRASHPPSTFIYALGVHLVRIALCTVKPANGGGGLDKAREWALEQLHGVELRVTLPFAEVARACLEYVEAPMATDQLEHGNKHLARQLVKLINLRTELRASLNGNRVPEVI